MFSYFAYLLLFLALGMAGFLVGRRFASSRAHRVLQGAHAAVLLAAGALFFLETPPRMLMGVLMTAGAATAVVLAVRGTPPEPG